MQIVTLEQFVADRQQEIEGATGAFSKILRDLALGAKLISFHLRRAALAGILGELGITNIQGETVQKLDHLANTLFRQLFAKNPHIAGFASEEDDTFTPLNPNGKYVILLDPLDGSSNIDISVPVGTIFSLYRRQTPIGAPCGEADFLQGGRAQAAAGYVLYGTSTLLFYTTGKGVHGFTLEPAAGDFILSHPDIKMPQKNAYYSFNDNQAHEWPSTLQEFIDAFHRENRQSAKSSSLRYVGSLVADFHRNLLKGGFFMYPGTVSKPEGKLRLLYEAYPIAWLMEEAGGAATNGTQPILDLRPARLHQRTPLFLGPRDFLHKLAQTLSAHVSVEKV